MSETTFLFTGIGKWSQTFVPLFFFEMFCIFSFYSRCNLSNTMKDGHIFFTFSSYFSLPLCLAQTDGCFFLPWISFSLSAFSYISRQTSIQYCNLIGPHSLVPKALYAPTSIVPATPTNYPPPFSALKGKRVCVWGWWCSNEETC